MGDSLLIREMLDPFLTVHEASQFANAAMSAPRPRKFHGKGGLPLPPLCQTLQPFRARQSAAFLSKQGRQQDRLLQSRGLPHWQQFPLETCSFCHLRCLDIISKTRTRIHGTSCPGNLAIERRRCDCR